MPARPSRPSRRRPGPRPVAPLDRPRPRWSPRARLAGAVAGFVAAAALGGWISYRSWEEGRPARLRDEARAATEAGDRPRALAAWHAWNATGQGTAATLMLEAQLAADLDRGRDAARLAGKVATLDPTAGAAWSIRFNRLRVLDRAVEAMDLGLTALDNLRAIESREAGAAGRAAEARRAILRGATLATLAEVPDAEARTQLDRWIAADPGDDEARVARLARIAAQAHPGDPDRAARIVELEAIVARAPGLVAAFEALAIALADSGEVARGQAVLDRWPPGRDGRGPRFDRLQARWDLDFNRQPARAAAGFRRALLADPHDWKSHYGLARACRTLGEPALADAEALAVARLRERLDPATLGPRLAADLARLDADPTTATRDLADLCRGVGLARLADAWSTLADPDRPASPP